MPKYLIGLCFLMCLTPSSGVLAATMTNYEETEQKIFVVENGKEQEITLGSQQTVEDICNEGCTIRLFNGDEYNIESNDVISIEDNMIFIDTVETEQSAQDEPLESEGQEEAGSDEEAAPDEEESDTQE